MRTREDDAQHRGGDDADQDRLVALLLRQARRRQADHDGIVAGQHQVDHDHLEEGRQGLGREQFSHGRTPLLGRWVSSRLVALRLRRGIGCRRLLSGRRNAATASIWSRGMSVGA